MRKKFICFLLCAVLLIPLTGCWDAKDLGLQIYALDLAIDEGETMPLRVTLLMPGISSAGSGGSDGSRNLDQNNSDIIDKGLFLNGYILTQAEGNSMVECLNTLYASITRVLSMLQLRGVYISESIAKSDALFESLTAIINPKNVRPTALFYVCKGRAEDVLRALNPMFGTRLSKTVSVQMEELTKISVISQLTLIDFYNRLSGSGADSYAIATALNNMQYLSQAAPSGGQPSAKMAGELPINSTNAVNFYGTVLFHKKKMVTALDGYETQLMNMCLGKYQSGTLCLPQAYYSMRYISLRQRRAPKISIEMEGDTPIINVEVSLEFTTFADFLVEDISQMEKQAADLLYNDLTQLLLKMQYYQADPIDFAGYARRNVLTLQQWDQYKWPEKYANARFNVKVNIRKDGVTPNT